MALSKPFKVQPCKASNNLVQSFKADLFYQAHLSTLPKNRCLHLLKLSQLTTIPTLLQASVSTIAKMRLSRKFNQNTCLMFLYTLAIQMPTLQISNTSSTLQLSRLELIQAPSYLKNQEGIASTQILVANE